MKKRVFLIMIVLSTFLNADFTRDANGIVKDSRTNLEWKDTVNGSMTWEKAIEYCEDLNFTSHSDWRVPNIRELTSLSDSTSFNPAINNVFLSVNSNSYYWSSTTRVDYDSRALVVEFYYGKQSHKLKSDSQQYVLCVRGGR